MSWAFFWKFFYIDKEYFGRFFYLLIFIISIFNFFNLLKISLIKKIIISLLLILLVYDYWHFRGYQEILIFSLILIISKYLYFIICEKKTDKQFLFIILIASNLIIWTKNEGIFFSFFIYLILSIFSKYNTKIKVINFTLFLTLILIRFLIYEYYELQVNLQDNYDFNNLIKIFINNIQYVNIILIFKHVFLTVFKFPVILFSLIFSLLLLFEKNKFKKILFLYFYLLLNLMFIFAIYLSTNKEVHWMVITGLNRVFFEASSLYLLYPMFFLKNKFKILKFFKILENNEKMKISYQKIKSFIFCATNNKMTF